MSNRNIFNNIFSTNSFVCVCVCVCGSGVLDCEERKIFLGLEEEMG